MCIYAAIVGLRIKNLLFGTLFRGLLGLSILFGQIDWDNYEIELRMAIELSSKTLENG